MTEFNLRKLEGRLYEESEYRRCYLSVYQDYGTITGEVNYWSGLHYIVESDNNGELIIHEDTVVFE